MALYQELNLSLPWGFLSLFFFTYETRAYRGENIPVVLVIMAHAEPVITSRQGGVVGKIPRSWQLIGSHFVIISTSYSVGGD